MSDAAGTRACRRGDLSPWPCDFGPGSPRCCLLCAALAVLRLAAWAPLRLHAVDVQPDGHDDHLRPVVQHADGPGWAAVVLPFGGVRTCRLFDGAFPQRRRRRRTAGADGADAAARWPQRLRLRHRVRLHGDQAAFHRLRDDHARHRAACHHGGDDVPPLLRRRGRREDRSRDRHQPVRLRIRPGDRGLLPDRRLDADLPPSACTSIP